MTTILALAPIALVAFQLERTPRRNASALSRPHHGFALFVTPEEERRRSRR